MHTPAYTHGVVKTDTFLLSLPSDSFLGIMSFASPRRKLIQTQHLSVEKPNPGQLVWKALSVVSGRPTLTLQCIPANCLGVAG